jgi:glutathione S-transferase
MSGIVLKYFPIRGRAQAIRHALADGSVDFEDVRLSLAEWPDRSAEPTFAGPYRALPTLTWDGPTIGETLPIAAFIARQLGQYDELDHFSVARLEGVCSHAYLEAIVRAGEVIWADFAFPGVDLVRFWPGVLGRSVGKMAHLDRQLQKDAWFGGSGPAVADFFAGEAYETLAHTLGAARQPVLRTRLPNLAALAARIRQRPSLSRAWERRPPNHTAHPDEASVLERLAAADLSAVGL